MRKYVARVILLFALCLLAYSVYIALRHRNNYYDRDQASQRREVDLLHRLVANQLLINFVLAVCVAFMFGIFFA